jgi:uncharacterized protein (TIGR02301 family)
MMFGQSFRLKRAILSSVLVVLTNATTGPGWTQNAPSASKQQPAPAPAKPPAGPEDRPYDLQLFRLAELLGTLHYLRELCGANEGQTWREQMRELASSEGTSALRRAKLVESFNRGYRDYSRTYRTCTQPALIAIQRFMDQASTISDTLIANDK